MNMLPTFEIQYAVDAPAYPLPTITTSVSRGSSSVDRKSRRGDSAASIQYDFVGLATGKTMLTVMFALRVTGLASSIMIIRAHSVHCSSRSTTVFVSL